MSRFLLLALVLFSCSSGKGDSKIQSLTMDLERPALEKDLIEISYPDLFMYGDRSLADSVWRAQGGAQPFLEVLDAPNASPHGVFLASEVLRFKGQDFVDSESRRQVLAVSYATALASVGHLHGNPYHLNGNLWGFLSYLDDPGYLGEFLIELGDAAVEPLKKLLDNDESVFFEGSKEATTGDWLDYRVKDFAAYYLSKIKGLDFPHQEKHADRDREVKRIQTILERQ